MSELFDIFLCCNFNAFAYHLLELNLTIIINREKSMINLDVADIHFSKFNHCCALHLT